MFVCIIILCTLVPEETESTDVAPSQVQHDNEEHEEQSEGANFPGHIWSGAQQGTSAEVNACSFSYLFCH